MGSMGLSTILDAYLKNEIALKRYLDALSGLARLPTILPQEAFLRAFAAESGQIIERRKSFYSRLPRTWP